MRSQVELHLRDGEHDHDHPGSDRRHAAGVPASERLAPECGDDAVEEDPDGAHRCDDRGGRPAVREHVEELAADHAEDAEPPERDPGEVRLRLAVRPLVVLVHPLLHVERKRNHGVRGHSDRDAQQVLRRAMGQARVRVSGWARGLGLDSGTQAPLCRRAERGARCVIYLAACRCHARCTGTRGPC